MTSLLDIIGRYQWKRVVQSSQRVNRCSGITIILSIMIKRVLTSVDVDIDFLKGYAELLLKRIFRN